jgi:hypothetical protein
MDAPAALRGGGSEHPLGEQNMTSTKTGGRSSARSSKSPNSSANTALAAPSKHALAKLFSELRFGRPAAQQKFLVALAKEWRGKNPRPVCADCAQPLIRTRIVTDGGVVKAWTCSC